MKDEATGEIYVNGKWISMSEEDYEDGQIDYYERFMEGD